MTDSEDTGKAQRRIRTLADLAARFLTVEELNALAVTIASQMAGSGGDSAIYHRILAEIQAEHHSPDGS